jgi:hypothetical protein
VASEMSSHTNGRLLFMGIILGSSSAKEDLPVAKHHARQDRRILAIL